MSFIVRATGYSVTGKVRERNEDNLYFHGRILELHGKDLPRELVGTVKLSDAPCYAVFDGLGGESNGGIASFIAASELAYALDNSRTELDSAGEMILSTLLDINEKICERSRISRVKRMGSTAAILCLMEDRFYVFNIGDSRVYRRRGDELLQLSQDHVYVEHDHVSDRTRTVSLAQHLGISPEEMIIEPYAISDTLRDSDQFVLCTDGLTHLLTDSEIAGIMKSNPDNQRSCVRNLIGVALERGGGDNITVIVCDVYQKTGFWRALHARLK